MANDENPITAAVLNAAMESLGLPDLRFDAVDGKPVLRRAYDDMSLEHFIGLLLTGVGAAYLQRVAMTAHLAELEEQLNGLEPEGAPAPAAERIASLVAELRRTLTLPVLAQHHHQVVVPKLTIGPIEPDQDLD